MRRAGPWRLLEVIARGATGTVFRARHSGTEHTVALKLLHDKHRDRKDLQTRFEREAVALRGFFHDHIVRYYDHGRDGDGRPFLAMELVEGEPGTELLGRDLTLAQRVAVVGQVASAVQYANDRGVLHRDLKWGNVLITKTHRFALHLKLIDFGVLKRMTAGLPGDPKRVTAEGSVVGTPYTASPEQIMDKPLDSRSDVYSLAVMTYELLSGRRPFEGATARDICIKHLGEEPPPLTEVPERIASAVLQAMSKLPDDRFATAMQFHRALTTARKADTNAAGTSGAD